MLQVDRVVRGVVYMRVTPWCLIACDPDLQSALACPRARCFPQMFHTRLKEDHTVKFLSRTEVVSQNLSL
jgi:hypothetical protein